VADAIEADADEVGLVGESEADEEAHPAEAAINSSGATSLRERLRRAVIVGPLSLAPRSTAGQARP
jgi:hypothetical protein